MKQVVFLFLFILLPLRTFAAPPNFIFLLIDDMGYGDLSCYGETRIQTKNIDRLASEGIRFTQFYVAAPICSPSRTGFLTGQFPARWRMTSYLETRKRNDERGMAQWLDLKSPSLARELKKSGYATGHFGKWHMGGQRDVGEAPLITEYGFDESLTQFEGLGDRILPLLDAFDGQPPKKYALGSDNLGRGKITWMDRSKVTGAFVDRALQFIKRSESDDKPFYVNVWPDDVHSPFFPPKELRGNATKKQLYLGVVKAMDEQLAPLFDYIRNSAKLRDNTIVIVASDNGPEQGAGSPGPFRGHKGTLYEAGVREPFIVWSPGLISKRTTGTANETTVVCAVDLFPSILKLAGIKASTNFSSDGQDLSAALLGKSTPTKRKPLFWFRPPDRPDDNNGVLPDLSMRDGDWKFLMMQDGSRAELYDLSKDLGETKNLADAQPKIVAQMKTQLFEWKKTLPVTLPPR